MFWLFKKRSPTAVAAPRIDESRRYQVEGNALLTNGNLKEATACYLQAIVADPGNIESHVNLGYVLEAQGEYKDAEYHLQKAVTLDPGNVDGLFMLGNLLHNLGKPQQARAQLNKVLALKPEYEVAFRANLYLENYDDAIALCDAALRVNPDFSVALVNRGIARMALLQYAAALADFMHAMKINPDRAELHFHAATALYPMGEYAEAVQRYRRAIVLRPEYADAYNNLATVMLRLNCFDEALQYVEQAHRIAPENSHFLMTRGTVQMSLGLHQAALESWKVAVRIQPALAEIHYNASLCRLQLGDFKEGWEEHEWRWQSLQFKRLKRHFHEPLWLGQESLSGKTILLHDEQGFGDTLQFCRYAELVAQRAAVVFLLVPAALASLLSSLAGVEIVTDVNDPLLKFDYHCPLMSLPLAFSTCLKTIPSSASYLGADPVYIQKWQSRLADKKRMRIGLVWSGNQSHANDHNRSIPLSTLDRLLASAVEFISLQQEVRPSDRPTLENLPQILHSGNDLQNFSDTAGLINCVDLVISVDTSVAHLAAALGKPVWVLLPFNADWRWLVGCENSPWYPTVRLFRQIRIGDWEEVIERVAARLDNVLSGNHVLTWPIETKNLWTQ